MKLRSVSRIAVLFFLLTAVAVFFCGCWDYLDVEELFIVAGFGVEHAEEGQVNIVLEVEKANPDVTTRVLTSGGETVFACIRNAIQVVGSKLYWGHTMVYIISEQVAKDGIIPVLDAMERAPAVRSDMVIMVTDADSVRDVFEFQDPIHSSVSEHLVDLFEESETSGKFIKSEMYQVASDISSEAGSLSLPIVHIKEGDGDEPVVNGSAVFKGDVMVGTLDPIQTRSMSILKGKIKKDYTISIKEFGDIPACTIEMMDSTLKVEPKVQDGDVNFEISFEAEADLVEIETSTDYFTPEKLAIIEMAFNEAVNNQFSEVVNKCRGLQADVFFFGKHLMDKYPDYWKQYGSEWNNDVFPCAEYSIKTNIKINASGVNIGVIKEGQ